MKYLTIILSGLVAVLLLGLIVTGVKYQQAISEVDRKQERIRELEKKRDSAVDRHWVDMQAKMKEAGR